MRITGRQLLKLVTPRRSYTQDAPKKLSQPLLDFGVKLPRPEYDLDYFFDAANRDSIAANIARRNSPGDIDKILQLSLDPHANVEILQELVQIPNSTDPAVFALEEPQLLRTHGIKPADEFIKPLDFAKLATNLRLMRTDRLGPATGSRSYVLLGQLADLEQALVKYTLKELLDRGFQLVSVPDILPSQVIERCGLLSQGERTLVYQLEPHYGDELSLSGTAEMALAYKMADKVLKAEELPLRLAAVSRCYRAEISNLLEERGIYRVHQFTKVEMFVCSARGKSAEMMDEIVGIQEKLFAQLGLHFKVLDMPPRELGSAAYRKIDIEAWMPGRNLYGEISSCSNCTDYQSRRLNIKHATDDGGLAHVHTLNGTACAVPRMLIALCETYQDKGFVRLPEVLKPYMNGTEEMGRQEVAHGKTFKNVLKASGLKSA